MATTETAYVSGNLEKKNQSPFIHMRYVVKRGHMIHTLIPQRHILSHSYACYAAELQLVHMMIEPGDSLMIINTKWS